MAKELVDSGAVFQTLAWTPAEAHAFCKDVPLFESAGVVVRVPASWRARRPPRPEVQVTRAARPAPALGADALLDFSVAGHARRRDADRARRSARSWPAPTGWRWCAGGGSRSIARSCSQRARSLEGVRGAARGGGLSIVDGLRLLAGRAHRGRGDRPRPRLPRRRGLVEVVAGRARWRSALAGLRSPEALARARSGRGPARRAAPVPEGRAALAVVARSLGLGGCLADDMGLGKTIQVIALLTLLKKKEAGRSPACSSCRPR